ncbi:MAG: hypothetical protein AAGA31_19160, partial [Bacteroidota bacterium]
RFELGEYLKLGKAYYELAEITNDGSEITLIRENNVSDKVGNQIGFIAPYFSGVTIMGDSVAKGDFKGRYLLIVNTTSCWSQKMSYEHYQDLSEVYQEKIDLLVVDESPTVLKNNINRLGLIGQFVISTNHRSIKSNYREDFCSRICFLIDPDGYIVDKFNISDWRHSLAKHFK